MYIAQVYNTFKQHICIHTWLRSRSAAHYSELSHTGRLTTTSTPICCIICIILCMQVKVQYNEGQNMMYIPCYIVFTVLGIRHTLRYISIRISYTHVLNVCQCSLSYTPFTHQHLLVDVLPEWLHCIPQSTRLQCSVTSVNI